MKPPIYILGAGIGGLAAAIHLAARGYDVTILEQNPAVGGKMSEMRAEGFRWDTGPSVITMRGGVRGTVPCGGAAPARTISPCCRSSR